MIVKGLYLKMSEINSVVPIGNRDKCRVTFNNGQKIVVTGYIEIMEEIIKNED